MKEFKNIILGAYGKRSDDGRRFIKSQELRDEFESTEAYSVLFMELVTETDKAVEFVNGVVPKEMAEEVAKLTAAAISEEKSEKKLESVAKPEPKVISRSDLVAMGQEEFETVRQQLATGEVVLSE